MDVYGMIIRYEEGDLKFKELKPFIHMLIRENESLNDKLIKIDNWCWAYPLEIFPEPVDLKKAAKILKENNMTLDAISASNFRHVLDGVKAIVDEN